VAALEEDNDDLQAWLWLSGAVESMWTAWNAWSRCCGSILRTRWHPKARAQLRARWGKTCRAGGKTPPEEVFREGFEKYQPEADERLFADPEETAEPDEVPTLSSIEPIAEEPREKPTRKKSKTNNARRAFG